MEMSELEIEPNVPSSYALGINTCHLCHRAKLVFAHSELSDGEGRCQSCVIQVLSDRANACYPDLPELYAMWRNAAFGMENVTAWRIERSDEFVGVPRCHACSDWFHEESEYSHNHSIEIVYYIDTTRRTGRAHNQGRCRDLCNHCNTYVGRNSLRGTPAGRMCQGCWTTHDDFNDWFQCNHCDDLADFSQRCRFNGESFCDDCYNDNIESCDDCDENFWGDDGHYCQEQYAVIKDYGYRPNDFTFHGTGKLFMGFELEVEAQRDADRTEGARYINSKLGDGHRGYCKYDGSLEDGFEIVTQPHTLEEYNSQFPWESIEGLRNQGFRSWNTNTCGLHIHVSRDAFGTTRTSSMAHQLRFTKLFYDNQIIVSRLAGRMNSRWASFADKGNLPAKIKGETYGEGHYSAINTENDTTLEIRIFKGSLNVVRVRASLELIHSAVEYTRDLKVSGSNGALEWSKFMRYVIDNGEQYPNFVAHATKVLSNNESIEENN